MNIKKMEKQVIENSYLLDKKLNSLIDKNNGKYIVFHKGIYFIVDTLKDGLKLGIKKFGENTGFVLTKLTKEISFVSPLVAL